MPYESTKNHNSIWRKRLEIRILSLIFFYKKDDTHLPWRRFLRILLFYNKVLAKTQNEWQKR